MENFIVQLRPKVVIFLVGVNDTAVDRENRVDESIYQGIRWDSFRSLERLSGALADHSEVAAAVLNLKRHFFPKVTWAPPTRELDLKNAPTQEMPPASKAAMMQDFLEKYPRPFETRLQRLIRICRDHQIMPVLMTQPALYGNCLDDVTGVDLSRIKIREGINSGFYWDILDVLNGVTRKVAREEQAALVDLAREIPKSSKYYYDLVHYDNVGAEKVASAIYQNLLPRLAREFPQDLRIAGDRAEK
jgi:lysophospholipase L1-like esterase